MSDLKKAQLALAQLKAEIAATGFDVSHVANNVNISHDPQSPSFGAAGNGNDFVVSDGHDVFGFGGDDILMGWGSGPHVFHGGSGSDTVAYVNAAQGMTIALSTNSASNGDTYDSIENVVGSKYNDVISGDSHANKLFGGNGDDTINGAGGNDTINGGAGHDTLVETLGGTQTLTGGADGDAFFVEVVGNQNFNLTITDFSPEVWTGANGPTVAEALADHVHDSLRVEFDSSTGVTTDAQADAAFVLTNGQPFSIVGHDVLMHIHTQNVDGTITLKGVADLLPDSNHHFSVYDFVNHAV